MAIRTTVSSNIDLSRVGMSTLGVSQHENSGATATDAPVLMSVAADSIVTANEFAALVANASPDLTSAFVARVLNALNETVQDIVDTATVAPNIDFGWGKFLFEIAGSVASASATPSPLVNYCYFSGTVATKYQLAFAQMSAYVDTAVNPCDFKRVRDSQTSALNTISGTRVFYADGRGFTWGTANDKQELYKLDGTKVCDLALDATDSYASCLKLNIPATATAAVGQYIVRIECSILGKAWRMEQKVNLISAVTPPAPTITKVVDSDHESFESSYWAGSAQGGSVIGTNFGTNPTVTVEYATTEGGSWQSMACTTPYKTATDIGVELGATPSELGAAMLKFKVTTAGGTVSKEITVS